MLAPRAMCAPSWLPAVALVLSLLPSLASAACGDAVVEPPEQCDDGAANGTPGSDCTVACEEVIPALRVPGGGHKGTDCQVETVFDLATPRLDSNGLPSRRQLCRDGDPGCDRDPAPGACSFAFWVCVAGEDARIGCAADHVAALQVRQPKTNAVGAAAAARIELLDKPGAYLPTGPGETCSGRMLIGVPARTTLHIQLRAASGSGRVDTDTLRLRCE
jgi:hypothetical protein